MLPPVNHQIVIYDPIYKRAHEKSAFSGLNTDMYEHLFAACSSSNGCLGSVCVCQTDPVRHQGD